jgi:hypothetical protein
MVDRSALIAASVYSWKLSRDLSSSSSLRQRRGSESVVARLQNRSGCPPHSFGLSCAGIRPLLPKTGHGSARPSTEASGPPTADASGAAADDKLGLSSAKVAGLRSPTSATTTALSSWPRTGRSGITAGGGASTTPTSAVTGGSAGESATTPAGVDVGAGNKSAGLEAATASAASPGMMAAPTGGSAREACPMATRAAWAPRWRAPCAEANQLAWHAAAPAAEAGFVLRAFVGARPAKPCLRLLKERESKFKAHSETPKQRYPQILTRSGARPIVPVGRPLGPLSPQALPRAAPPPASAPFLPRTPEAPRERPAQASSRRPRDRPPVQPARVPALGGQADRPDPPESQQLSRPRGQVPPRPASAPRIGTLVSRPQALVVPAHLEAGSATPSLASGPG